MFGLRCSAALVGAVLVTSAACHGDGGEAVAGSSSEDDGQGATEDPDDGDEPGMVEDSGSSGSSESGDPPAPACGDGLAQAPEECDGSDLARQSCESMGATGTLRCTDTCTFDICDCVWEDFEPDCDPPVCGNGNLEGDEECDGQDYGRKDWIPTCEDVLGSESVGEVACSPSCEIDTSACRPVPLCGNGALDPGEACDGSDVGGATCETHGFVGGEVFCDGACGLDLSHCGSCGDGVVDADEACDGAETNGFCGCTDTCTIDEASCIDVMISEILYAPLADPEAKEGQWIELFNPSDSDWPLQGCVVTGDLAIDTFDIDTPIVIPAGGYATLGTGTEAELGFVPTFAMPVAVTLFNEGDTVTIACGGLEVDTVTYSESAPWPAPAPGIAVALAQLDATANDDGASWCAATTPFGPGHFGTPGAANDCL